jgi:hypothetical protein
MYGPAGSSVNVLHVGSKGAITGGEDNGDRVDGKEGREGKEEHPGLVFEEGGDEEGMQHRQEYGIPDTDAARKKYFLDEENRKKWLWEEGRSYGCDFFNPYLNFNGAFPFPMSHPIHQYKEIWR